MGSRHSFFFWSIFNVMSPQQDLWDLAQSDQITASVFQFYDNYQWTLFFCVFMIARSSELVLLVITLKLRAIHFNWAAVGSQNGEHHSSHVKTGNPTGNASHRTSVWPFIAQPPFKTKIENYKVFTCQWRTGIKLDFHRETN